MVRVARSTTTTPVIVEDAIAALGSVLRLELIRFYRAEGPATQADAMRALGAAQKSVQKNVAALLELGVLRQHAEPRTKYPEFVVDEARVEQLLDALAAYAGQKPE